MMDLVLRVDDAAHDVLDWLIIIRAVHWRDAELRAVTSHLLSQHVFSAVGWRQGTAVGPGRGPGLGMQVRTPSS